MKKALQLLLLIFILTLTACTGAKPTFETVKTVYQKPTSLVEVNVLNNTLVKATSLVYFPKEVVVSVKNLTDKPVSIKWEESSINAGTIFKSGMKFIDAGKTIPNTVIFPKATEQFELYSAEQISYTSGQYGGWGVRGWFEEEVPIKLVITFEQNGVKEQYLVEIAKGNEVIKKQ